MSAGVLEQAGAIASQGLDWRTVALGTATVVWGVGWALDVTTTVRGIRRAGSAAWERNPLARWLLARFGAGWAFVVLGGLESFCVAGTWSLAFATNPGWIGASYAGLCVAMLALVGVMHTFAAHANATGRLAAPLRPILVVYDAISRGRIGRRRRR